MRRRTGASLSDVELKSYAREERAEESDLVLPPTKRAKEDCGHPKKITATKQVERSAC